LILIYYKESEQWALLQKNYLHKSLSTAANGMIHCMVSEKKTSLSIRLLEETTRADVVIVVLYRRWFILQH
jgi:hypothetical protein